MFFDVVIVGLTPIYNNTPENTRIFLERNKKSWPEWTVVSGRTLQQTTVAEYMEQK